MEQFEDDEEIEFQAKFEDKFQMFCAKISAKNCEDVCIVDERLFLDELGEKTRVENFKSKVPFVKRKLDLSIFTFDEPTSDQSCENISQEDMVTHTHHMEQLENDEKI